MAEKTNRVRRGDADGAPLDATDRKLLRLLAEDASRSFAELSALVNLSAPAVHERVKRLKRDGVIAGTVARLDAKKIGCPLLAFIHVDTEGWTTARPILALEALADVEEIHSITGDARVMVKARTRDSQGLEALLERISRIEGVRRTRSFVVLNTYLERGPKPELEPTEERSAGQPTRASATLLK